MKSERKWFLACLALVFLMGFLMGMFATPFMGRYLMGGSFGRGPVPEFMLDKNERGKFNKVPPMMIQGGPGDRMNGPDAKKIKKEMKKRVVQELDKNLNLTKEQEKQIGKILDENEKEFQQVRKEMRQKFINFNKKIDGQIIEILDEKQEKKFKEFTKQLKGPMDGPEGIGEPGNHGPDGLSGPGGLGGPHNDR